MKRFVDGFALWIALGSALSLVYPPSFGWVELTWINPMLGVIMLGMGLTLTWDDFARVGRAPRSILLGVLLQFSVMPLLGWGLGLALALETQLAVGLVLVACCPGGTASNVIAYIARADVALSVSMTLLSTLLAVIATPLLTTALVGSRVTVDPLMLLAGTAKVVLIPVLSGLTLSRFAPGLTRSLLGFAPVVAVIFIVLIVAGMVSEMQASIVHSGPRVLLAVAALHVLGSLLGYLAGRLFGPALVARTVSIEVGMQNAGLGIALARGGAFASPLVALPCALSAVLNSLVGSSLAAVWSRRPLPTAGDVAQGSTRS